jgi:hypothetical protein
LTFGSIKKDRIFINILTVNNYLKGTILSVKHNTIQKTKKISSTDSTTKNNAVNPGVLKESITSYH